MSLMTELIDAMRFVKIQGVESQWEERVAAARRKEIRKLIWSRVMTFLFELLWTVIPVLVTLVSFFFYVKIAKEELTISTAFTAIALFTMIRPPLNAIPGFLMGGLIAMVSVQRLESFLNEQEVDQAVSQLSRQSSTSLNSAAYKDEEEVETNEVARPADATAGKSYRSKDVTSTGMANKPQCDPTPARQTPLQVKLVPQRTRKDLQVSAYETSTFISLPPS